MSIYKLAPWVLLATLLSTSGSAFGNSAAAERLLALTHARNLAVPVYAQVQQMFAQRFNERQKPANKASVAVLERYQAKANALLDQAIGWERLQPSLVALYRQAFSDAELQAMVDFYESPVGRKMLRKLPDLNRRSAQLTQSRLENVAPEVTALLDAMEKELDGKH